MSLAISIDDPQATLARNPEELIEQLVHDAMADASKCKAMLTPTRFMAVSPMSIHGDMLMPESRNTTGGGEGHE